MHAHLCLQVRLPGTHTTHMKHFHFTCIYCEIKSHVDFYLFQLLWITRQRAGWCSSTEPSSWWMEVLAMSSNLLPCVKVPQHTRLHVHKQAHVHKTNQCLHTHIKADVQTSVYFLWLDWIASLRDSTCMCRYRPMLNKLLTVEPLAWTTRSRDARYGQYW